MRAHANTRCAKHHGCAQRHGYTCNTMPFGGSTGWFKEVFGFVEGSSFSKNRAMFSMEGDELVCKSAPHPRQWVGPFETPNLAELRTRLAAAKPSSEGGLSFAHLATPVGIVPIIMDEANAGAVFQAASQFNALEMVGPGVTPRQGISGYASDPTQGPKVALAAPAGTVYRNYLVGGVGQGERQIDCLEDVGRVVGGERYWTMKNGYALPTGRGSMAALGAALQADPALVAQAEAALRVAVHWDTQVKPPHTHRVAQVYASALPVAYDKRTPSAEWEPFARLVLRAAYDATLATAACKSAAEGGRRVRVYLTALGGGAFGNRVAWIVDALQAALETHREQPLDVVLVHYGSTVRSEWAGIGIG